MSESSQSSTTSADSFVHLHVHSEYSLLDGASKIKSIVKAASEHGSGAIALTDHGVMFGSLEFYHEAKKQGIKPIVGVEAYMAPNGRFDRTKRNEAHITLLAMNEEGYQNLGRLVTLGYTEGYYYKPRIDMELLEKYNAGIICLSGCLSGLVQEPLKTGDYEGAKKAALAYQAIFGDRFYLEIMRHNLEDQNAVEGYMLRLRDELNIPLVATNDSHYTYHADHDFHEVLCCLQSGKTMNDPKRFKLPGDQFYIKTPAEMREVFADMPEACDETLRIAERINIELTSTGFHIPEYPIPPEKQFLPDGSKLTPSAYLRKLCLGGIKKRYPDTYKTDLVLKERMEYELGVIDKMGFSSYFLIVWDFIKYARDHDIPVGPGRGSAVGSLVSYCLGITGLDPLRFGLYFERFLNPDRISMPDIDTDFCVEGRDEVIKYVTEKYGSDRVCGIVTFGTMASRSSIRDAARALEIPLPTADRLAKLVPSGPKGLDIAQSRKQIQEIVQLEKIDPQIKTLMETAQNIEGFIKSVGTHAAAVVISDAPLTDYLPLVTIKKKEGEEGSTVNTQYEMDWIEKIGLLKMDFLGLRNLTVMHAAEKEIRATVKKDFDLALIPDDDKKTFAMLARGETSGVFQLESDGMRHMLMSMKPDRLDDIVAAVALYRPGPMELIPQYISGKHGRVTPQYLHPKLEPILNQTHGIAIYQEQIMQIARDIAGFTMGQADELRKVMGKKIKEKVVEQRKKFVDGAVANNVKAETAERIFDFVEPFAGYGFNKSHAVAYGWISYQTAYLKANYPLQYLCALISSVADKTDKLVEYVEEARAMKIAILPPSLNTSKIGFSTSDGNIRFGFGAIKGVTNSSIDSLVAERDENGPYTTIFDLVSRTRELGMQRKTVESLIKVGACKEIPGNSSQQLMALDQAFDSANRDIKDKQSGQLSIFGDSLVALDEPKLSDMHEAPKSMLLQWEYEGINLYLSGHPIDAAAEHIAQRGAMTISEMKKSNENRPLLGSGMVKSVRRFLTKQNKPMMSAVIEDRTGMLECVAFPTQYDVCHEAFIEGAVVVVTGSMKSRTKIAKDSEDDEEQEVEKNFILNGAEQLLPPNWNPDTPQLAFA